MKLTKKEKRIIYHRLNAPELFFRNYCLGEGIDKEELRVPMELFEKFEKEIK